MTRPRSVPSLGVSKSSKRVPPKAGAAPQRELTKKEAAHLQELEDEWDIGYASGLRDGRYDAKIDSEQGVDWIAYLFGFGAGIIITSIVFLVSHALHWWS